MVTDHAEWLQYEPPHPSDRATLRARLAAALGLALIAGTFAWGLSGYRGLWTAAPAAFGEVAPQATDDTQAATSARAGNCLAHGALADLAADHPMRNPVAP